MALRKTPETPESPPESPEVAPEAAKVDVAAVPAEQDAPAIPDPIVALDADGNERPLSGSSFIRRNGKLVREG